MPQDQFQYIKLPDGSFGKFAADATDDQIRGAIAKDFPDAFKQTAQAESTIPSGNPLGRFASSSAESSGLKAIVDAGLGMGSNLKQAASDIMHGDWGGFISHADAANPLGVSSAASAVKGIGTELKRVYNERNESIREQNQGNIPGAISHAVSGMPVLGPIIDKAAEQYNNRDIAGEFGTLAGPYLGALLGEGATKVLSGETPLPLRNFRGNVTQKVASKVAGRNVDRVIPGDTVTPRQRYEIAKKQGVQLDLAQATGGTVPKMAKRPVEHSLGGSSEFEDLQAKNREALNASSDSLLNQTAPPMSRVEFGDTARAKLLEHQQKLYEQSGKVFDELSQQGEDVQPDVTGIRARAQQIFDQYSGFYAKHPEMLRGGATSAWKIVKSLAEGKELNTWSDLQKLRSNLMDMYQSSEIVGTQPEGWLKQLTGAISDSMESASSGLSPEQLQRFRNANELYAQMKGMFDNPQNPLFHIVRTTDGLQAADLLAGVKPSIASYIMESVPELRALMQRQKMERILTPAGNGSPEWGTLPGRLSRAQKEALSGTLTPEQIKALDDLATTSRIINADSNASGSGKVGQASKEAKAAVFAPVAGIAAGSGLAAAGHPLLGAITAAATTAAPFAELGITRGIAKAMTNPEVVDRVMSASKGPAAWMEKGAANLQKAGVSLDQINKLRSTATGRQMLKDAGDVSPNSKAMESIVARLLKK